MIIGLSPMDGVTDAAMRYMTAKYSHPDIMITEFVSVDALHHATGERRERLLRTLMRAKDVQKILQSSDHSPKIAPACAGRQRSELLQQTPVQTREIAQIFGHNPEYFKEAAELIESLGFDGIDINMGCPMHKVEDQGSGAGLIRTPELAKEIIQVVKAATKLPVSVKTRIGVDHDVAEWWTEQLMEVRPTMISLHGRTLRQLYQGRADWEAIGRAAEVVHKYGGVILGNGDVGSMEQAAEYALRYGVDGVLIGRAAEGNPAIFNSQIINSQNSNGEPSKELRLAWMMEHVEVFESINKPTDQQTSEDNRWFMPIRKHLAWYCRGFPGAVELRSRLMQTSSSDEVAQIVRELLPEDLHGMV